MGVVPPHQVVVGHSRGVLGPFRGVVVVHLCLLVVLEVLFIIIVPILYTSGCALNI